MGSADTLTVLRTNSTKQVIKGCDVLMQLFVYFDNYTGEALKKKIASYLQTHPWYGPLVKQDEEPRI
jgi:hypothetical protein